MFGIDDSKIGIDLDGGIGFVDTICFWKDIIAHQEK